MKSIDKLVKDTLNPPVIIKLILDHTIEELEELEKIYTGLITEEEGQEYIDNCIDIDIDKCTNYIITNERYIPKLEHLLDRGGVRFLISNASRELFEMDNIEELLLVLKEDDDPKFTAEFFPDYISPREEAIIEIKKIFERQFSIDDVLDLISKKGIDSLNRFHREILFK